MVKKPMKSGGLEGVADKNELHLLSVKPVQAFKM